MSRDKFWNGSAWEEIGVSASVVIMGDSSTLETKMATKATGTGTASGTNTGDETLATIKSKLAITTLSGSNTGDQRVPKTARFTVGTSTSGWTAGDCDYLCDGINDQIKINAAITALPATGGEIIILDGTYNITAKISVNKSGVTLSGNATILKRMYDSTVLEGVVTVETGVALCTIRDFTIDGNKVTYAYANNQGIHLNNASNNTISNNICKNIKRNAINGYNSSRNFITGNNCYASSAGIFLENGTNSLITANTCNGNIDYGIYLKNVTESTITGNTCLSNTANGLSLETSSNNTISGNGCNGNTNVGLSLYISSNNSITCNTCNGNSSSGIKIDSSSNNTISGNTCNDNNLFNIILFGASRCNVTGNSCMRGTGTPADYTAGQCSIILAGTDNSYNLVSSNLIMGKDVLTGGGIGNTYVNNKAA